jgi:hypothetical protein
VEADKLVLLLYQNENESVETVTVDEDRVELVKSRNTWLLVTERRDAR